MKRALAAVILLAIAAIGSASAQTSMKDAYKGKFYIGTSLNMRQINEADPLTGPLIKQHYNSITPENILKWAEVHPQPEKYNFEPGDRYVAFGKKNKMFIVGHTLVWHSQTPRWVFQGEDGKPCDRETLLKRMRDHIMTVVGRYKGQIHGWDVVNEALNDDGTMRQSPWLKIIGEDFIAKAFQYAHEADPKAELYYNDYSLALPAKRKGAVELIKKLKAQGVPISGVGLQGHLHLTSPTLEEEEATVSAFEQLGLKVHITELDIDVLPEAVQGNSADISTRAELRPELNPYTKGLPDAVQKQLTDRYVDLFRLWMKHPGTVKRVTFWGVTDGDSWKNGFPVRGRTNYPLLFDRQGKPKPVVDALIRLAKEKKASGR